MMLSKHRVLCIFFIQKTNQYRRLKIVHFPFTVIGFTSHISDTVETINNHGFMIIISK